MLSQYINSVNIHVAAVAGLSVANVWLFVQNVRWLMYSYPVSSLLPAVDPYSRIDLILEVPGIIIGIITAYVLVFRYALGIWRIRYSLFRRALTVRVLTINSALLLLLTVLGVIQWAVWYNMLAIDVIVVASIGGIAAFTSASMEWHVVTRGNYTLTRLMPLGTLRSLSSVWHKSSMP